MKKALLIFFLLMFLFQIGCSRQNSSYRKGASGVSSAETSSVDVSQYSYNDYYEKALEETNALDDIIFVSEGEVILDTKFKLKAIYNNTLVLDSRGHSPDNSYFSDCNIKLDNSGVSINRIESGITYATYYEPNMDADMSLKQFTDILESLDTENLVAKYLTGEPYEYHITYGQVYNAYNLTSGKIKINYLKIADDGSVSDYTPDYIYQSGYAIDDNEYFFITPYYIFDTDCSWYQGGSLPSGLGDVYKQWIDEDTGDRKWANADNIICVCFSRDYKSSQGESGIN